MKWIIVLLVLLLIAALIAVRFRRQIQTAIYIWRMFGKLREAGKSGNREIERPETGKDAALVRCAKCGTWIPQNKALNLRSGIFFCSKICLETTARAG